MPGTRGRGTGDGGWSEPNPHPWRAVCAERCTHGSERDNWKRASCLLYLVGRWFDPSWAHLEFVIRCHPVPVLVLVFRWCQTQMRPGSPNFINWNQVDLIKLCTIQGKILALPLVVPQLSIFPCDVVVGCIKLKYCTDAIPNFVVRRFGAREIAPRGRRSRAQAPPRTAGQPGRETRRGKEHVGKAEWPEGM
jgi:hypothetical protein